MHPVFPRGECLMIAPCLKVGTGSLWQEDAPSGFELGSRFVKVGALPSLCSPGSDPG